MQLTILFINCIVKYFSENLEEQVCFYDFTKSNNNQAYHNNITWNKT